MVRFPPTVSEEKDYMSIGRDESHINMLATPLTPIKTSRKNAKAVISKGMVW